MKKKIGILLVTIILIMILPVFTPTTVNDANATNKETNENSVADLKTSGWNAGFNYSMNVNANYDWIEINVTGTKMTNWDGGIDDGSQGLNLTDIGAWKFKYFGRVYEYLNVCTNGWMTFSFDGDPTDYRFDEHESYEPPYIPQDCNALNMGLFNSSIFVFGSDLDLGPTLLGGVYYEVLGTAPKRRLIIEYDFIAEQQTIKNQTFQVIFYERGDIKFQYKRTTDIKGFNNPKQPTVGLDNGDLINYNNVSIDLFNFNATGGVKEKAIYFRLNAIPPTPLPSPDDDDDDDEEALNMGVVVIVIVLACVGGVVVVIIVLIKKGIIDISKLKRG